MPYLFPVEPFRRIERLYECRGMTDEQRVAGRAGQHTDHGQPHVGRTLWGVSTEPYTQHVRQGLEESPRVLLQPVRVLNRNKNIRIANNLEDK
jgi:hypothetical protein